MRIVWANGERKFALFSWYLNYLDPCYPWEKMVQFLSRYFSFVYIIVLFGQENFHFLKNVFFSSEDCAFFFEIIFNDPVKIFTLVKIVNVSCLNDCLA